ncbi:MAG: SLBB domain-containing protein [Pseudomonadota bacterium]
MPRGTTFLQALAIGGGLTPFAADKRVQLRRRPQGRCRARGPHPASRHDNSP